MSEMAKQAGQAAANKPAPEARTGTKGRTAAGRAPVLLELAYVLSVLVVGLAGLSAAGLSLAAGVAVWVAVVRAGLLVLVLGALLWFLNYQLMHGVLDAALQAAREKQAGRTASDVPGAERASLGMEWKA